MAEVIKTSQLSNDVVYLKAPVSEVVADEPCTRAIDDNMLTTVKATAFAQGFAQATSQLASQTASVNSLLQQLPAAIKEHRLGLSSEIADIVLVIVQQFFINQQQSREAISQQINHVLHQLNHKQNIELALHPHDVALLQQGKITLDRSCCADLRIVADDQLRLGGCLIKSEHGVFDAGIERQIDQLKQLLLQLKQSQLNEGKTHG